MKAFDYKKTVAESFSRSASQYDHYASVQQESVKLLRNHMKIGCRQLPAGPILEFGCGTGSLSEVLIATFPGRPLLFTDLSEGMIARCRERLQGCLTEHSLCDWQVLDAENIEVRDTYAFIVSGLTIQWFQDVALSLKKITDALLPGGVFLCSFVDQLSFPEWRSACSSLSLDCVVNDLPCGQDLNALLRKNMANVVYTRHQVPVHYPTAQAFFQALKKTGTSVNRTGKSLSAGEMKMLMRYWNNSRKGRDIVVTYHIHLLMATK